VTRGSRYKIPRFVRRAIESSAEFQARIGELAAAVGRSPREVRREARGYFDELIPRPTRFFIDLRVRFDRFMMSLGYEGLRQDADDVARLRETLLRHPTVVLFTHKTYVDGTAPTLYFYDNDLPMPHTIGGINMAFFGLGFLYRRSGTIFIRRAFQNNPVYKLVLRRYLAYLLEKRFPMSWAFEGGRSRLGKLMPPRYGLLKYVLEAAHDRGVENLHIVPFVTSFDLIRDVDEYALEQRGRTKKPESAIWFLGYLRSLRRPMGRMRVDLGEAVVLDRSPPANDRMALAKVAFQVAVEANRATPLTVSALTCLILLGAAPRGATERELAAVMTLLTEWAQARGIRLADEFVGMDRAALVGLADKLVANGLIVREGRGADTVYAIDTAKHAAASYYRNTIVHHFLDKAIIELALVKAAEGDEDDTAAAFWNEAALLRDWLKFEFFFAPQDAFRANLAAELATLAPDWAKYLGEGPAGAAALLAKLHPLVGHAALLPFVEAYTQVFEQLAAAAPGEDIDAATATRRSLEQAERAYLLRRISSQASIGRILFDNGYQLAANLALTGPADEPRLAARRAMVAELAALLRRMERMRLESLAWLERTATQRMAA
jgi:glycerol-3-phosphate O-acyltransferase